MTALPVRGCGTCFAGLSGAPTQCRQAQLLGLTTHGGFAERVVVGARESLPVDAGVPPERGGLSEPLAVGLHTVLTGDLAWRDPVASWYVRQEWDYIVAMLHRDRVRAEAMVTHVIGPHDLPAMYEQLKEPTDQGKVLVAP